MYVGAQKDRLVPKMDMPTEAIETPMLQHADTRPSMDFAFENGKGISAASASAATTTLKVARARSPCKSAPSNETDLSGGISSHCFPRALGFKRSKTGRLGVAAFTEGSAPDA